MKPIHHNDFLHVQKSILRSKLQSRPVRILLVALCSISVLLSCNLPTIQFDEAVSPSATFAQQEMTPTPEIKQESAKEQSVTVTPTAISPSMNSPEGEKVNKFSNLGIDKKNVMVYLQQDGTLIFERSDGSINKVKTSIDINERFVNISQEMITFPSGNTIFLSIGDDFSGLVKTDDSGVLQNIPFPDDAGQPVSALPSPDGSQIIWLFDNSALSTSSVDSDCDTANECKTYHYHILRSDGDGNNASLMCSYEGLINDDRPELHLYQWKSDSKTIFLRWEYHDSSIYYPDKGGKIIEVSVPDGRSTQWNDNWQTDTIINPDGNYLATANDYENGYALSLSKNHIEKTTLPLEANHLLSQMTFSPDNSHLSWIETVWDDTLAVTGISLKSMDLDTFEVSMQMDFDVSQPTAENFEPDMPHIGTWLTDELLVINDQSGSRILNIQKGEWLSTFDLPASNQPLILLDYFLPRQKSTKTLSDDGPWLILKTENGFLWAMNEDGTGLTQLTSLPMVAPNDLSAAVSPDGTSLAYITSTDPERNANLTLNLLTLPEGTNEIITVLTSPESEPDEAIWEDAHGLPVGDRSYEATRAIITGNALAWSPNGKVLAFVGAQNGPSSDLFTYTLADKSFIRMSSGPSQAYNPTWSPDGNYIVHFGASSFNDGSEYDMVGVWVSPADIVGSKQLYDPSRTGNGENLVGWLDNETFVVYSVKDCPGRDLRSVNINSGLIRMLYNDYFYQADISPDGTLAVVNEEDLVDQPGLYLLSAQQSDLIFINEGAGNLITYSEEAGVFLVRSSGNPSMIRSFTTGGLPGTFEGIGDFPVLSADGSYWAWNESGGSNSILLKDSNNEFVLPLTTSPGYYPVWNQGSDDEEQKVFFFSSNKKESISLDLYVASSPDFDPQPIKEKLAPAAAPVWMIPE